MHYRNEIEAIMKRYASAKALGPGPGGADMVAALADMEALIEAAVGEATKPNTESFIDLEGL